MNVKHWLVPDEVQSSASATLKMFRAVSKARNFWSKQIFAFLAPVLIGVFISYFVVPDISIFKDKGTLKDVITNIMTFGSVLAGFVVTLMLFTGRTDGANSLSVDQANDYISKVKYLIFSQILTLIVYLSCILTCLWWLVCYGLEFAPVYLNFSWHLTAGLLLLSVLRTVLLPLQIYEVHDFELQTLHDEKTDDYEKSVREFMGKE